jgi:hypothetical protein
MSGLFTDVICFQLTVFECVVQCQYELCCSLFVHENSVFNKVREIGFEFEKCLWTNDFTPVLLNLQYQSGNL